MRAVARFGATRVSLLLAFGLLAATAIQVAANEPPFTGPVRVGKLAAPPRNEASGLMASRRMDDLLWVHDDSGGEPALYGVSFSGAHRCTLRINGVRNRDWEDVASFELGGTAWLLIGEIGDNDAKHRSSYLYLVAEPPADRLVPG